MAILGDSTTFQDMWNAQAKTPSGMDYKKFNPCTFAGIPFNLLNLDTNFNTWFNQVPTATDWANASDPNTAVNASNKQKAKSVAKIYMYAVGEDAATFTITGIIQGTENRKRMLEAFTTYNAKYVNRLKSNVDSSDAQQNLDELQADTIKSGYAKIQLPLTLIQNAMVISHKWNESPRMVGQYIFTVQVKAIEGALTFQLQDPSLKAQNNIFGAPDSFLNKCLSAIKDFNLSYWEGQGIGAYNDFMNYSGANDILSAADNINNVGKELNNLGKMLNGDGQNVGLVNSIIDNMINRSENFVQSPQKMFESLTNLFNGIISTGGDIAARMSTFGKLINSDPPYIEPSPYNAIKIINNRFINSLIKGVGYISYCGDVLKNSYSFGDEIAEERKKLLAMYDKINPVLFNDEIRSTMNATLQHLDTLNANNYYIVEHNVTNMALIPLAYTWFKRISLADLNLIKKLNPGIDFNNITGKIRLPNKLRI